MKAKLIAFALKRLNVSKWLPTLFKMIAEGKADELLHLKGTPLSRAYWALAGKKTWLGMAFTAIGAALETLCSLYPDAAPWSCPAARYLYIVGAALAGIGLIDGGTRSPYPAGTTIPEAAKTR